MPRATLIQARTLTPTVRELTFQVAGDFDFTSGQWTSFRLPVADQTVTRSYSIASGPRSDNTFDIAVTRVEQGPGSNYLHGLALHAELEVSRPQGFFCLEPVRRPVLMIATGTGVSPFRSMLHSLPPGSLPITLLLGVRTQDELLYRQEWEALSRSRTDFRFVPSLSRPDATWTSKSGYVQSHLSELLAGQPHHDVYVCGLSRMVKEVRALLKEQYGYSKDLIHTERFD